MGDDGGDGEGFCFVYTKCRSSQEKWNRATEEEEKRHNIVVDVVDEKDKVKRIGIKMCVYMKQNVNS